MSRRKSQDEKDLEKLAKKLLSMPHKPREESKIGKYTHTSDSCLTPIKSTKIDSGGMNVSRRGKNRG